MVQVEEGRKRRQDRPVGQVDAVAGVPQQDEGLARGDPVFQGQRKSDDEKARRAGKKNPRVERGRIQRALRKDGGDGGRSGQRQRLAVRIAEPAARKKL